MPICKVGALRQSTSGQKILIFNQLWKMFSAQIHVLLIVTQLDFSLFPVTKVS